MADTPYIETNALLAAQNDDRNALNRELSKLTTTELQELRLAAIVLANHCTSWIEAGGVDLSA